MNDYKNFESLEVWKKARALKLEIHVLIKTFPVDEKFRLCDQLIRSTRSICANIAEGHGRQTKRDQLHFCVMARGSLSETLNHMIDACDQQYISYEQLQALRNSIDFVAKLLNGYMQYLKKLEH